METNKEVPTVAILRSKLFNMIQLDDARMRECSARANENVQLHKVLEDLCRIADGDGCLEDIDKSDPKMEIIALKTLVARKEKENKWLMKSKEDLERRLDHISELTSPKKRCGSLDQEIETCNVKDHQSLVQRMEEMKEDQEELTDRMEQQEKMKEEQEELMNRLDNTRNTAERNNNIDQFEQNEFAEQLLISNDDLTNECRQLKKKLSETEGVLTNVEEELETLRAGKLWEKKKSDGLVCELALSQARVLHLEQVAEGFLTNSDEELETLRAEKLQEKEKSDSLVCELALSQARVLHLEKEKDEESPPTQVLEIPFKGTKGSNDVPNGRNTPYIDPAQSKLFVGGLSWKTTSEKLREYFGQFGNITDVLVMKDPITQRNRGFGFISFSTPAALDRVLAVPTHTLDDEQIDPKPATPKSKTKTNKTKKIFVGGVSQETLVDDVKAYFNQFGSVEEAVMLMDQQTKRHRGFGFVTFESDEVVDIVCEIHFHSINNKKVECKKYL